MLVGVSEVNFSYERGPGGAHIRREELFQQRKRVFHLEQSLLELFYEEDPQFEVAEHELEFAFEGEIGVDVIFGKETIVINRGC